LIHCLTRAATAALISAVPCFAEPQLVAVPAGDHLLAFTLPDGFELVNEGEVLARLSGETVDAWTELITLTVDPDQAAQDPALGISLLGNVFQPMCPDTLEQTYFGSMDAPGSERGAYSGWNSCGTVIGSDPARSEQQLAVAVSGGSGMYVLGWSVRGAAVDDQMDIDDDALEAQLQVLTTGLKVCPTVAGEAAPYPSCVGG
jgi:hypothetical protein